MNTFDDPDVVGITLTPRAAAHVRRWLGGAEVRLRVKPTGCSGYAYVIEANAGTNAADRRLESEGICIVVDPTSLNLVRGTQVDYVREGLNAAFQFHNPNVTATCGCGESFTVAASPDSASQSHGQ